MSRTRVQICNERFLLRFGVDRILTLLAAHLVSRDMDVGISCLRADREALSRIVDDVDVIDLPSGLDVASADDAAARHVIAGWQDVRPDVLVTGGWPFFGIAARASSFGVRSLFIDAGAVPHDGLSRDALPSQLEIRRLRQRALPSIDVCLPISAFIRESQTEPDRGSVWNVTTVGLGCDHLAGRRFDASVVAADESGLLASLDAGRKAGARFILLLGRFEASGYKNAPAAFQILRAIAAAAPDAHLLLLAGPDTVGLAPDIRDRVTCLPTIGDDTLQEVMRRSELGLAVSLWEGFNLPLAEMQHLNKPVLAFSVGAHPEVVADPWFLCRDNEEMAHKAVLVLSGRIPPSILARRVFETFSRRFAWDGPLERWEAEIRRAADGRLWPEPAAGRRLLLVDVTNAARDPANSGVIRVCRRLTAELARNDAFDVVPVCWNLERSAYRLPDASAGFLSSNSGPTDWLGATASRIGTVPVEHLLRSADPDCPRSPILFTPEVMLDGTADERLAWARSHGLKTAAILYDLLPVFETAMIGADVIAAFPSYLAAMLKADLVLAISRFTEGELRRYCLETGAVPAGRIEAIWLPGQFGNHPRTSSPPRQPAAPTLDILCVSTIEPRKNHRSLVKAFRSLRPARGGPSLRLNLVGNRYGGAPDLAEWIEAAAREDGRIVWHQILPDAELARLFETAAFTIYPSLAEGFGLPIMESLWMGRPCICHSAGVMAELAAAGGCLTADMSDPGSLSAAIETLAGDEALRTRLTDQATGRQIGTWTDYAALVADQLAPL